MPHCLYYRSTTLPDQPVAASARLFFKAASNWWRPASGKKSKGYGFAVHIVRMHPIAAFRIRGHSYIAGSNQGRQSCGKLGSLPAATQPGIPFPPKGRGIRRRSNSRFPPCAFSDSAISCGLVFFEPDMINPCVRFSRPNLNGKLFAQTQNLTQNGILAHY